MLPFWSSIIHARCAPSTEIESLAGILECAFFYSPVRVLPFWSPFLCSLRSLAAVLFASGLVTVGPRMNPYRRHLSLNHQSSIINHEVYVGL